MAMSYQPTHQRNHQHLDGFAMQFVCNHYRDASYNGYVYVATRQRRGKTPLDKLPFKVISAVPIADLIRWLSQMHVSNDGDYYITANTFTSPIHRDYDHLFSINNIVIDIDCHREDMDWGRPLALSGALMAEVFLDDVIPEPNTIVFTGHGLQLWWAISPMHIKEKSRAINMYNWLKHTWCNILKIMLPHSRDCSHEYGSLFILLAFLCNIWYYSNGDNTWKSQSIPI